jgi:Rha family phage regulatory protein
MNTEITQITQDLTRSGKTATVSSLKVAERFGKRHTNVLRAIESLELDDEFGRLNFEPSSYLNEQNKEQPCYNITRDGFAILAMGFTGPEAMKWKKAYIQAFNQLEQAHLERLQQQAEFVAELPFSQAIIKKTPLALIIKLQDQSHETMVRLRQAQDPLVRQNLYWTLRQINDTLGIPTPDRQALDIPLQITLSSL